MTIILLGCDKKTSTPRPRANKNPIAPRTALDGIKLTEISIDDYFDAYILYQGMAEGREVCKSTKPLYVGIYTLFTLALKGMPFNDEIEVSTNFLKQQLLNTSLPLSKYWKKPLAIHDVVNSFELANADQETLESFPEEIMPKMQAYREEFYDNTLIDPVVFVEQLKNPLLSIFNPNPKENVVAPPVTAKNKEDAKRYCLGMVDFTMGIRTYTVLSAFSMELRDEVYADFQAKKTKTDMTKQEASCNKHFDNLYGQFKHDRNKAIEFCTGITGKSKKELEADLCEYSKSLLCQSKNIN